MQNGTNGHGAGYKRAASNKNALWEKIRKGQIYHLVKVCNCLTVLFQGFGISASDFGVNVKENTKRYWTEDPDVLPEDMAKDYAEEYGSAKIALNGISNYNNANNSRQTNADGGAFPRS